MAYVVMAYNVMAYIATALVVYGGYHSSISPYLRLDWPASRRPRAKLAC